MRWHRSQAHADPTVSASRQHNPGLPTPIIAADAYNRVYYFESQENLAKANAKLQEK